MTCVLAHFLFFLIFKLVNCNVMKKSTLVDFHINEGVRNAIIVLAIFGVIAFITYLEWSNKIN